MRQYDFINIYDEPPLKEQVENVKNYSFVVCITSYYIKYFILELSEVVVKQVYVRRECCFLYVF